MLLDENNRHSVPPFPVERDTSNRNHLEPPGPSAPPEPPEPPKPPTPPGPPEPPEPPTPPGPPEKPITVIVNGVEKRLPLGTHVLSYEEVVRLAYGSYSDDSQTIYTVVYSNGPAENRKGSLVKGKSVKIQKGMIFNVGRSDKS